MLLRIICSRLLRAQSGVSQIKFFSAKVNEPEFLGLENRFTNKLAFTNDKSYEPIPIYRIINAPGNGKLPEDCQVDNEILLKMYYNMTALSIMDKILYESQRQGRISFYMTNTGEEALQIGSAAALTLKDSIYAQYREAGLLLWRGFSFSEFIDQCYGNLDDKGKGKQMPVHYGSQKANFVTISSPLSTQIPQAAGMAYAYKLNGSKACAVCYFGDGAASEGDAHAGLNFAATLQCPVIFICRNNGYAISTPTYEQYRGDGIGSRGPANGIDTIRVDGNDVLAMYHATKFARDYCVQNGKPVFIEAMTYRCGAHSTSDDGLAYRTLEEVNQWTKKSPIRKFYDYLQSLGIWSEQQEKELVSSLKKDILSTFTASEKKPKPHWKEIFTDVYTVMPGNIRKQVQDMEEHIKEYHEHYPLKSFNTTQ